MPPPPAPVPWSDVERLFAAALDGAPEERDALLAGAAPAVRERVLALLAAHATAGGFLDHLDAGRAVALLGDEPAAPQAGPYRLVREVGRGGMGVVYLAERVDGQFEQRVALKLVKRGLDSDLILQRFLHERQILARLAHPNVARLLDGGRAADGRPYFAMEYVEGVPLTDYCDARQLPVDARLRLFETVCEAVRYAHQNLVVHRDLKPSNILVTADGTVKLLDFGIAKLLGDESGEAATLTRGGAAALTPEYAAPEQVRGEAVTTATDVYALGVVLYELLTGHRPYHLDRRAPHAFERIICTQEPERPSSVVLKPRPGGAGPGGRPERLRRQLARDLDWIVLTALRKDPARRYASADVLLDDLRRYRAGRPVQAGPERLTYRGRKFVERHRVGMSAALLVAALLVVSGVFYTVRINAERDRARSEADKARQMVDVLTGLFEGADPWNEAHGQALTARALLDRGVRRIETGLAAQPEVQATMWYVLGDIYRKLGYFAEAESLLTRSLALRERHFGPGHLEVAESEQGLAQLLTDRGAYDAAEPRFRTALAVRTARSGPDDPAVAALKNGLGALLYYKGAHEEAERLLRDVLARRRARGEHGPDLAYTLNDLALVLIDRAAYAEAETLLTEALALHRRHRGDLHPDVASTLNNLAMVYDNLRQFDRAEPYYRASLDTYRRSLGDVHPQVALLLDNLSVMLTVKGDYDAAEAAARESLALRRQLFAAGDLPVGESLSNLGYVFLYRGDPAGAEPYFEQAVAIMRRHTRTTPQFGAAVYALAEARHRQRRDAEAEPLYREALAVWRTGFGDRHVRVVRASQALGVCLLDQGRYAEAEAPLREALRIQEGLADADSSATRTLRAHLARLYTAWGRPEQAAAYQ